MKIALGGFVSFTGLVILACVVLALTGDTNLAAIFQNSIAIAIVSAVGTLDIVCGLLLVFRNKEIVLSLTSHQEKTHNHADQTHGNPKTDNRQ